MIKIVAITCLGIIVYSNSFFCSFHLDDIPYIINNSHIRNIHHLLNIWAFFPCRFVTFFSLAFNYHFNQLHVVGYHLFNIAIHVGSALLVWWLTLLTFSTPAMKDVLPSESRVKIVGTMSLLTGLVFVSHPVQVESVTYIWQRATSLEAFFYLASMGLYVKSRLLSAQAPSLGRFYYIFSLMTAVLAMFTKENSITLPLMILLYEFSFFGGEKTLNWKYLSPFFLTLFIIPITMLMTQSVRFQEIQGVVEGPGGISPQQYLLTQFRVMMTYIRLSFLPLHLNLDYDYPVIKSILEMPGLISFLTLVAILFSAIKMFSKYRLISFSIFWFFLTLLPDSSILPQKDLIFEHRLYLPLVGYSMFLVSSAYYVLGKNFFNTMTVVMMIVACYSVMTYQRNKVWLNEFTLWNDSVQKSPHKLRSHINRGIAYYANGNLAQAKADFTKAIEIDPKDAEAFYNLGIINGQQGDFAQAIADFNRAITIDPDDAMAYYNRGLTLYIQGKLAQALSDYNKAIEIYPGYAQSYDNRGVIYYKQGQLTQAMADYNKAIAIDPHFAEAYADRGVSWENQGNLSQSISDYNKAIAIDPKLARAYHYRGLVYYKQGHLNQALSDYDRAIDIDPNDADVYNDCGSLYGNQGKVEQAIADFDKAIVLNPKYADAYNNRAVGYYALKEYEKAWTDVHKVEALGAVVSPDFINELSQASGVGKDHDEK